MNADRALEILQASERIDVERNGVSVWIDSVDMNERTVKIHAEHDPAYAATVSPDELQEVQ